MNYFVGMDYMFYVNGMQEYERVEEASEVVEETSTLTSTSDHSLTSSCRRKDLVSLLYNLSFVITGQYYGNAGYS